MAAPWLVAGLGNPGPKYERTRHNAGFRLVDALVQAFGGALRANRKLLGESDRLRIDGAEAVVLKPDTWMNNSGQSVRAAADFYSIPVGQVLVVHDELDLPPGTVRLKFGGGHGGHNGLRSTFSHLGSPDFWRLRVGIGHPGIADAVTPWVLSRAPAEEETATDEAIGRAVDVLPEFLAGRAGEAMKVLHARGGEE